VLEAGSNVKLAINANCVRKAKWFEYLGYQKTMCFTISLSSIINDGGLITCIDVILSRVLPPSFTEYTIDGKRITRNEIEEEQEKRKWENDYQLFIDKGQSEILKQNPSIGQHELRKELECYLEEHKPPRNVKICYNIQVTDHPPTHDLTCKCEMAIVSIWDQPIVNELKEGTRLRISHLHPSMFGKEACLLLKSTSKTKLAVLKVEHQSLYVPRALIPCSKLIKSPRNSLVDVFVVVIGNNR
jgi:hypothetical protein